MTLPNESFSLVRRLSRLTTWIQGRVCGEKVGHDDFGNIYYRARKTPPGVREKRWVMYAGEPEASKVPPEWHIWLHHTADAPIDPNSPLRKAWQKPHQPNMTGTDAAYFPPSMTTGKRAKATGDYESWTPEG